MARFLAVEVAFSPWLLPPLSPNQEYLVYEAIDQFPAGFVQSNLPPVT